MKSISIFIQEALKIKPNNTNNEIYDETHKLWEDVNKNLNNAAGDLYAVYYEKTSPSRVIRKIVYQTYMGGWKTAEWNSTNKKPEWISAAYKTKEEAMAFAETNKKNGKITWEWYFGTDDKGKSNDYVETKPHVQSNDPKGVVIPEIKGFKEQVQAIVNAIEGAKLGKAITKRICGANAKAFELIHPNGIVEIIDGVYKRSYSAKGYTRKGGLTIRYPQTPSYSDGAQYPLNGTKTGYTTASGNTAGYFAEWINKNMNK
jgi:hypothetical protein